PYANGDVHLGTGLNKVLKDIVNRFKSMRGFYSPYKPGWDCHGLPIERKALENSPPNVKESPLLLREKCKEFALKYIDIQRKQFRRLGVFGIWETPYRTLDPEYEYEVLRAFVGLVEKNLVTRDLKPIHWCIYDSTALAEAELEYKEKESDSIFVRFPLEGQFAKQLSGFEDLDLIIWTTTPWTLPANVAVAIHPRHKYSVIKYSVNGSEKMGIVMSDLTEQLKHQLNIVEIVRQIEGDKLDNIIYKHPILEKKGITVLADYVSNKEGTGLVHTAPGHGLEDFASAIKYKLEVLSPVDDKGCYTSDMGSLSGFNVFKANSVIVSDLKARGLLISSGKIRHSYPHCWRCKQPVIFRATKQWFVNIDKGDYRQQLLDKISEIKWFPNWGKNRIEGMVVERPNWCISRQRKWGIPIPAMICSKCDEACLNPSNIMNFANIVREKGTDAWYQLSDKELSTDLKCETCGSSSFVKENSTFDVWFDSACSHRACKFDDESVIPPYELYLEGTDQHRGWFQVSLIIGVLTGNSSPFKNCLTHGFFVEPETGEKISKSTSKPEFLLPADKFAEKFGADVLRLWFSSINFTNDIPFSSSILEEKQDLYRKIRNTFRFMLGNINDLKQSDLVDLNNLSPLDKWLMDKLATLMSEITEHYENYEFYKVFHKSYNFCDVVLSSTYFHIVKDILYTHHPASFERRSCQTALYYCLDVLLKCFAPILVHTSEEIWKHFTIREQIQSIHLAKWPGHKFPLLTRDERNKWDLIMSLRDEINKAIDVERKNGLIGSSLEAVCCIYSGDDKVKKVLNDFSSLLQLVFVLSDVSVSESNKGFIETQLPSTFIKLDKSPFSKCKRCWKLVKSVGTIENGVCKYCYDVLVELNAKSA
ncbi:MAG: isoleucine--tRNA ligase, partial [Planctomycetes bacterium]|nr:isoleucine--tRNA ligase [Planctomycetota bacterium]